MMPKYHNKKVPFVIEGNTIMFDSKAESVWYLKLLNFQRDGVIKDLELQPEFELQEGFYCNGKKIRSIKYIADFKYTNVRKKQTIVDDVKGMKTDVYNVKKKLFLFKYGKYVKFREINFVRGADFRIEVIS